MKKNQKKGRKLFFIFWRRTFKNDGPTLTVIFTVVFLLNLILNDRQ